MTLPIDKLLIASISMILLLSACQRDTCTQGDNMTNPRVSSDFESMAAIPVLTITWDNGTRRGADLPDDYFAEVVLSRKTEANIAFWIESVDYTSNPKSISVQFKNLSDFLIDNNVLSFSLAFPDRIGYIDCSHPGMGDEYFLGITLSFSEGEFEKAEFEQTKRFGPL